MSTHSFGRLFTITIFGESHGISIGVVIDGCPSGVKIQKEIIQKELDRRKPGQSTITTARQESDEVEILSGIFEEYSTGAPITLIVRNKNQRSKDYSLFQRIPRPSQIDYPAIMRFGEKVDLRGSGEFSGRITAAIVMAGSIAKLLLSQYRINIGAWVSQIGTIKDSNNYTVEQIQANIETNLVRTVDPTIADQMIKEIQAIQHEKDSIGGIISVQIENFPPGIGDPWFHSLESDIATAIFAIPGVRGIEFGKGFQAATMKGSDHNDSFCSENGKIWTKTNNSGGIIGGISIGTPILCQIAIKPTASIGKSQMTLNLENKQTTELKIEGRHDPCIVPRALVVVENMIAIVILDQILVNKSRVKS
jgi:chorismate synthase